MNHSKNSSDKKEARGSSSRGTLSSSSGQNKQDMREKRVHKDVDFSDPELSKLSVTERSKLLRAKRNREAAHRSRTKNKIQQTSLEEDTKKQLQLNKELTNLMNFLLPEMMSGSASAAATKTISGSRKTG